MAEDKPGGAAFCEYNGVPDYSGAGGGMSASENRMANYRGKVIGDPSGPKSTSGGADLGPNAKNTIMKMNDRTPSNTPLPGHGDEVSPASTPHSRNRGSKTPSYK